MNPQDILRYVDSLHREKNIDAEIVFSAIEAALMTAARRQFGEEADISVRINRESGTITAVVNGVELDQDTIGRIGAQTAKQVIIQKVREAERDALLIEYRDMVGQMVTGIIGRADGSVATVQLGNVEAILPRSEQIPGESLHANERVRAVVFEVRATGNRVRVVLSRKQPQLVQRLFEQEIPELTDGVIDIRSISREPGYRSKVAVSSADSQVDPIAVCVGYRGSRIKAVREELSGEHIDVVRFSDDPQVLIPNALQPATIEQVLLCDMIGRAIVLVQEDQLSLAIGRRGQNVRLASKLCGWDIEIMTAAELEDQIERAVNGFADLEGMTEEIAQALVEQGYLSYDDLSVIEPDDLMSIGGLTAEQVDRIVEEAESRAEEAELAAAEEKRQRRELERQQREAGITADENAQPNAGEPASQPESAATPTEAAADNGTGSSDDAESGASAEATEPSAEGANDSSDDSQGIEPNSTADAVRAVMDGEKLAVDGEVVEAEGYSTEEEDSTSDASGADPNQSDAPDADRPMDGDPDQTENGKLNASGQPVADSSSEGT